MEKCKRTNFLVDMVEEGQVSSHFTALLSDTSLRKAIVRLTHHLSEESAKEFTEQTAADCLQQLTQISVLQVPCVRTVQMRYNKKVVSSQTKTLCFVHNREGEPRQSVVYLDTAAGTDLDRYGDGFLQKLVSAIQFVLDMKLDSVLLYRLLKSPRQANTILNEAGIKQFAFQEEMSSSHNPQPGSFVPLRHHQQLDNDFYEFSEGEQVAYEVYDPLIVYDNKQDNSSVYIYARILHEICDSDKGNVPFFAKHYQIDLGPDRGKAEVSVTRLYKIIPSATSQVDKPSASEQKQQMASPEETNGQNPDTTALLKDIHQTLTQAWQVCKEEERRYVTKRLLLKWHPDKNSGKESVCTRVTEAIFQYIELLSQSEKLIDDDGGTGVSRDIVDGQSVGPGQWSSMRQFAHSYVQRQSHHAHCKTEHSVENPQPEEGWRWLHTAQCDLAAARASRGICEQGRNWVCFLCHQAAEKAMKGVLYLRDADNQSLTSHSLPHLARQVSDAPLQQLAQEMEARMGPHTRMRYPDVLVFPNIPADVYSDDDVNLACDLAWHVLERAEFLMKDVW